MAELVDYNDYFFMKKSSLINKADLTFYEHETPTLRFVVINNVSKKISFKINPLIDALSFNPEMLLKDGKVFELKINASLLPKDWSGDLLINDCGIVNTVELNFSKKELE